MKRIFYPVIMISLPALIWFYVMDKSEMSEQIMNEAKTLYQLGQFSQAEHKLREVIKSEPGNATALELLGNISLWKNSLSEARQYFDDADKQCSWLARHWPMHTQRRVRQAITAARMNRYDLASQYLKQAAGPFAFGSFKALKVRSAQAALFAETGAYQIEGDDSSELEFVVTDPLPVIHLSINGSDAVNFVIDTGGENLYLDPDFAREVSAQLVGEITAEYAGAQKGPTGYGRVNTVILGNITLHNVPVSILDLKLISEKVFNGMEIKGIVGTNLLMQFLTTIDYPNKQLIIRRRDSSAADSLQQQLRNSNLLETPIWLIETHLIFAKGSFNKQAEQLLFIDTGLADAGFHSSQSLMKQGDVEIDWSKTKEGPGGGGMVKGVNVRIDEVSLGSGNNTYQRSNLTGVVFEKDISIFKGVLGFQVGGLVSHEFFKQHALTFDFENMRLFIH